jgi:ParB/RepB/Spo0J family partition protein
MNAPAATAVLTPAAFSHLPLAAFAPSGTRTQARRRARFTPPELAELAANIKAIGGVIEPIVARPHPQPSGPIRYEIVAGERRWLAGALAGLTEVPALVREVADADLVAFQLTENLQRKTIDALEEAEGYDELRKAKKLNADQVADLLGVSRSTVFNRLKLLELCPEARKAIEEGKLAPSSAMLIARIGHHDTQRKALVEAVGPASRPYHPDNVMSYRDLQEYIAEHYMIDLKAAPFRLDDEALLPKAGTCVKCPKRTGNQKDLFADVKNPNVCTDPQCYDDKRQATHAQARVKLELKGEKIIHGEAAKKLLPRWDRERDAFTNQLQGPYVELDDTTWAGGKARKARDIVGPDYKPVLIQHPGTGKIIECATQQAVSRAANPGAGGPAERRRPAAKTRPSMPEIDDVLTARLAKLIHEKAPAKFSRAFLLALARLMVPAANCRREGLEAAAKAWGWPGGAFKAGDYGGQKFPLQAAAFDERKLVLLMFDAMFAERAYWFRRKPVLDVFGIDERKVREQIIAERKAAATKARAEAKAKKEVKPAPGKTAKPKTKGKK